MMCWHRQKNRQNADLTMASFAAASIKDGPRKS
jgi:hypothetical protein